MLLVNVLDNCYVCTDFTFGIVNTDAMGVCYRLVVIHTHTHTHTHTHRFGNASQGIWGRHACYGRHDAVWEPHPEPDFYCGRRVIPAPPPPLPATSALRAYAHVSSQKP